MEKKIKRLKKYHEQLMNKIYKIPQQNINLRSEMTLQALKVLNTIEFLEKQILEKNRLITIHFISL